MPASSYTIPSMRKPTQIAAFCALYSIAAADGRGEALFGDSFDQALDFYQRTLIGDGYPIAHLEFPLLGEPCLDLLSVHRKVPPGAKFATGAGYGHQAMFDWFAEVGADMHAYNVALAARTYEGFKVVHLAPVQPFAWNNGVRPEPLVVAH